MRLVKSRASVLSVLAFSTGLGGCETICDEAADEAEASGCAVGVLPEDVTEAEADELTACEGDSELRATCLVENTSNVCSFTDEEALRVDECVKAGAD